MPEILKPLQEAKDFTPDYNLTPEQARSLCAEFTGSRPKKIDGKFACYQISGTNKFSNLGRFVESTNFDVAFQNDSSMMSDEYGPYDEASTFFIVFDQEAEMPIGVLRTIENSSAGLKSLVDLENSQLGITSDQVREAYGVVSLDSVVDIGTVAIASEYRGPRALFIPSKLMYRALYRAVLANPRFEHAVSIVDKKEERNLKTLKFPFRPILDSDYFPYLGSTNSRALYAHNSEFLPQVDYWANRYSSDSALDEDQGINSDTKKFLAEFLHTLAYGDGIDDFIDLSSD